MAESPATESGDTKKAASKLGLLMSVAFCLAGAAIGYFAVSKELVPARSNDAASPATGDLPDILPDVAFVEIPPLIVTLPTGARGEHLRFAGQIEVPSQYRGDVEFLMPRIQDALNGYLRALTIEDIEGQGALFKIRLQVFRRIVMVVGLGKANSVLVTEFILN